MSTLPAIDTKKMKAEAGKLKKILEAVKKALSKELLWVLFIVLLGIPVTLIVAYLISLTSIDLSGVFSIITEDLYPSFVVLYIACVIGIYFSRIVALAIKTQLESKTE
ncbi:hypothetical protein Q4Q35_03970 [Flavivirga aquimarina]|uniref:Uncharacterized protein n=1 Tax=Flavivirga aquimarina TaxID=2027862 RepID=A0ABT8W785_9FLAO|nr:hypothetical protein [Flavivirga aquimarina]MDO5968955.1 hypothetical protein [Flavivirga aquimarina]